MHVVGPDVNVIVRVAAPAAGGHAVVPTPTPPAAVVVVLAVGKETDDLLHLATQVSKVRPGREMDMLITAGERKATALLCMALHDIGVAADSFTGSQAGFITDGAHTNAKIVDLR